MISAMVKIDAEIKWDDRCKRKKNQLLVSNFKKYLFFTVITHIPYRKMYVPNLVQIGWVDVEKNMLTQTHTHISLKLYMLQISTSKTGTVPKVTPIFCNYFDSDSTHLWLYQIISN